jgi:hypothetical protein
MDPQQCSGVGAEVTAGLLENAVGVVAIASGSSTAADGRLK